jgi:hypothetical protein
MGLLDDGMCPSSQGFFYCGTSLPLVSFTRLLLLATSSASFFIHARGLIYFTCYHIHGHGLLVFQFYLTAMLMRAKRVFIGPVWSTWTMSISTSLCQDHSGWVRVCMRSYSVLKWHIQMDIPLLCYPLLHWFNAQSLFWQVVGHWLLLHVRVYLLKILHPTTSIQRKYPDSSSGAAGYMSSGNVFYFFLGSLQKRPSNFLFQIARGSGAIPVGALFFCKKRTPLENSYKNI